MLRTKHNSRKFSPNYPFRTNAILQTDLCDVYSSSLRGSFTDESTSSFRNATYFPFLLLLSRSSPSCHYRAPHSFTISGHGRVQLETKVKLICALENDLLPYLCTSKEFVLVLRTQPPVLIYVYKSCVHIELATCENCSITS